MKQERQDKKRGGAELRLPSNDVPIPSPHTNLAALDRKKRKNREFFAGEGGRLGLIGKLP